jgi:hypothetical protein
VNLLGLSVTSYNVSGYTDYLVAGCTTTIIDNCDFEDTRVAPADTCAVYPIALLSGPLPPVGYLDRDDDDGYHEMVTVTHMDNTTSYHVVITMSLRS